MRAAERGGNRREGEGGGGTGRAEREWGWRGCGGILRDWRWEDGEVWVALRDLLWGPSGDCFARRGSQAGGSEGPSALRGDGGP